MPPFIVPGTDDDGSGRVNLSEVWRSGFHMNAALVSVPRHLLDSKFNDKLQLEHDVQCSVDHRIFGFEHAIIPFHIPMTPLLIPTSSLRYPLPTSFHLRPHILP